MIEFGTGFRGTIIVLAIVLAVIAAAVAAMIKDKRAGKSPCGGCNGCNGCHACKSRAKKQTDTACRKKKSTIN